MEEEEEEGRGRLWISARWISITGHLLGRSGELSGGYVGNSVGYRVW